MNLFIPVVIGAFLLWCVLSFGFGKLGNLISKIADNIKNNINDEEKGEQ